ncbi:hypothetical protein CsSME_00014272 [Camellia sinensis var. sinensis]
MTGEIWEVGLDVIRTDRALVFYESEANQTKLWNILAIYAWVDNSIGYVQGIMKAVDPKLHQHLGMADPARRKQ